MDYPKWKYGLADSKMVADKAEEKALGANWFDTPQDAADAQEMLRAKADEDAASAMTRASFDAEAVKPQPRRP